MDILTDKEAKMTLSTPNTPWPMIVIQNGTNLTQLLAILQ